MHIQGTEQRKFISIIKVSNCGCQLVFMVKLPPVLDGTRLDAPRGIRLSCVSLFRKP